MPKSYIKSEPGAMRALLNHFDPYKQVRNRLLSLTLSGHPTDKIEMIVLGGTWDVYPEDYKIEFIKNLYDACNTFADFFGRVTLADELDVGEKPQEKEEKKFGFEVDDIHAIPRESDWRKAIKANETAEHRIIGLTIETRPEFVTDESCRMWRDL
jgi:histone acetyltransferase (RNA polymerase elongator complex component)